EQTLGGGILQRRVWLSAVGARSGGRRLRDARLVLRRQWAVRRQGAGRVGKQGPGVGREGGGTRPIKGGKPDGEINRNQGVTPPGPKPSEVRPGWPPFPRQKESPSVFRCPRSVEFPPRDAKHRGGISFLEAAQGLPEGPYACPAVLGSR